MRPVPLPLLPVLLLTGLAGCDGRADDAAAAAAAATPVATGAHVIHGDSISGAELAAVLGCGACHPGAPAPEGARAVAPDLGRLEGWEPAALAAYLRDPVQRRSAIARMPDFGLDAAEAAAVTRYLLRGVSSRVVRVGLRELGEGATAERGAAIVAGLNCAGCHEGTGTERWAPAPPVAEIAERVRRSWLASHLAAPRAVRPFGYHPGSGSRMPVFALSPAELDSLVGWLSRGRSGAAPERRAATAGPEPSRPLADGTADQPLSAFGAAKAEALLRDHLSCLGCHSLHGDGGRVAPALDAAAERLRPEYLRRVVREPRRAVAGTIMPRPLEDSATLELVTAYLLQGAPPTGHGLEPGPTERPERPDTPGQPERPERRGYLSLIENEPRRPDLFGTRTGDRDAARLYAAYCAVCHGADGAGDGFNASHLPTTPTPHADPRRMAARADATLFDGIHGGGHILGKSHRMPGFGATLAPDEIGALVAYIRRLCSCEQPEWAVSP